jgi:hypothetical protein
MTSLSVVPTFRYIAAENGQFGQLPRVAKVGLAEPTPEIADTAALRAAPGLSPSEPAVAALGGAYSLLAVSGAGSPSALEPNFDAFFS